MEQESDVIPVVIGALCTVTKNFGTGKGGLRSKRSCGDHSNYSIVEIDQNTEKSSGNLKRLPGLQQKTISKRWYLKLSNE